MEMRTHKEATAHAQQIIADFRASDIVAPTIDQAERVRVAQGCRLNDLRQNFTESGLIFDVIRRGQSFEAAIAWQRYTDALAFMRN